MIVSSYGVASMSMLELSTLLDSLGVNYGTVQTQKLVKVVNRSEGLNTVAQPVYPVVFNSGALYLRTLAKLKGKKVVAFVIDNPITLSRNLGLPLLGAEVNKLSSSFTQFGRDDLRAVLAASAGLSAPVEIVNARFNPVDEILKKYEQSDLSKLQTLLYKIKDVDSRDRLSKIIKTWLKTSAPYSTLEPKVHKEVKPGVAETFRLLLTSPSVGKLRLALKTIRTKDVSVAKAARTFKVSSFDLRYLIATK